MISGTVTEDLAAAIKFHSESIYFRTDLASEIRGTLGKVSFQDQHVTENLRGFLKFIKEKRPVSSENEREQFPQPFFFFFFPFSLNLSPLLLVLWSTPARLFTYISLSTPYSRPYYLRLSQFPESVPDQPAEETTTTKTTTTGKLAATA